MFTRCRFAECVSPSTRPAGTHGGVVKQLPVPMASPTLRCYVPAMPLVVTCGKCGERVLEADAIGDEEECALRDHLMLAHPATIQPHTREAVLRHFAIVTR